MKKIIYISIVLISLIFSANSYSVINIDEYKQEFDKLMNNDLNALFLKANELKQKAKDADDKNAYAFAEMYIGNYYLKNRIHDKSLTFFFNSQILFNEIGNQTYIGQIYSSIGAAYRHLGDYEKAREYAMLSYENSEFAPKAVVAKILNRIGDMHRDLKNIDSAFYYYYRSLEISEDDFYEILGDNYNNIGDLFKMKRNYDSASYYFNKSILNTTKANDPAETAENYTSLALLNLIFNKPNLAVKNIAIATDILSNFPRTYEHHNTYTAAIEIYSALNMKDSLILYLYKLMDIEREANKEQLLKSIVAVELEQSLRTKELEYELLKKESDLTSTTNYFLTIVVILIAFLGLLLFKQNHQKKQENQILQEQKAAINIAKEELQIAYDNIHELNATKDKFFSIIAHDLRNPLGSFKMLTALMHDQYDLLDEDEKKEFIKMLNDSADNLHELLENLLDWARSQRGAIKFEPANINVHFIAQNTLNLLKSSAEAKNIHLINEVESDFEVFADANLITTVLRNLVANSIKFTPNEGSIKISSEQNIIDEDGKKYHKISVSDTGIGISDENMKKLFRIDVNFTTPGTANEKGTGLGLILCKEFVEKHNGKIWVESTKNVGTTFHITTPS